MTLRLQLITTDEDRIEFSMIQPARYTLRCKKGSTFRKIFSFYSRVEVDGEEVDTPIDFTGCTARMMLREDFDDAEPIHTMTTENGGITITDNEIELYISDEDTAAFPAEDREWYRYDLEIEDSLGEVQSPLYGKFKIRDEVTK